MAGKKERPTFEIHFHEKVGQNINHIDSMHVQFDKDMNLQIGQVDDMHMDGGSEVASMPTESKNVGRPSEMLFADEALRAQEAKRVKQFLTDNLYLGIKWNTSKENVVQKMVVCFYKKWKELGFLGEAQHPSPSAVVNFFMKECGIQTDGATEATLKCHIRPWTETEIDEEMNKKVCKVFPQ